MKNITLAIILATAATFFSAAANAGLTPNGLTLNGLSGHNGLKTINGLSGHNGLRTAKKARATAAALWIAAGIDPSRPLSQATARR